MVSPLPVRPRAIMQTLLFDIFKRNEPDTLLELAYLRKLGVQNAQEKALTMGRRLKPHRDENTQMQCAIGVICGSSAATEPRPPQTIFSFRIVQGPFTQQCELAASRQRTGRFAATSGRRETWRFGTYRGFVPARHTWCPSRTGLVCATGARLMLVGFSGRSMASGSSRPLPAVRAIFLNAATRLPNFPKAVIGWEESNSASERPVSECSGHLP